MTTCLGLEGETGVKLRAPICLDENIMGRPHNEKCGTMLRVFELRDLADGFLVDSTTVRVENLSCLIIHYHDAAVFQCVQGSSM